MSLFRLLLFSLFTAATVFAAKPNVIIIYVDDMGYGDASCLNPKSKFQTPNIDRLAKQGVKFTNAYAASAN